mmetsp:Transcript_78675/g.190119  ORF Transcript_78675/g.190119 Transcript_78675/m.190119 type:complete len:204 (+) Transcript_78675:163-774(+)
MSLRVFSMANSFMARSVTFCTFSSVAFSCSRSPSVASRSVNLSSGRSSKRSSLDRSSQCRSRMPGLRKACTTGTFCANPPISSLTCFAMPRQPGRSLKLLTSLATLRWALVKALSTSSGSSLTMGPSSHSRCQPAQSLAVCQSEAYGSKSLTIFESASYSVASPPKRLSRLLKVCAMTSYSLRVASISLTMAVTLATRAMSVY